MKTNLSNKPVVIQVAALRALVVACLVLGAQCFVRPAFGQTLGNWPFIVSTNAYWNVTDITDPGQPVALGELQAPYSKPFYALNPPCTGENTLWHFGWSDAGNQLSQAFGTTPSGGAYGHGTIFALANLNDQNLTPNQLVVSDGVIYGTTSGSTADGQGTVFKVNIDGSGFKTLHVFRGYDGANPHAGLVVSGGVLYGTTSAGGLLNANNPSDSGVVFSINTDGTGFTNLYTFTGGTDGGDPEAGLVLSGDTLYGTTANGGPNGLNGSGVVFSVKTDGTGFSTIHSFEANGANDGAFPLAGLVMWNGYLYGTTSQRGPNGNGTVFAIDTTHGNAFIPVHAFSYYGDGANPEGGLVVVNGVLYGTTFTGGDNNGDGVVFSINTLDQNQFSVLHYFDETDGQFPEAGLFFSNGVLYGTTAISDSGNGNGEVFSVNADGTGGFTILKDFTDTSDGEGLMAGLVLSGNVLYGTASQGGTASFGTIFSIDTANENTFAVLKNFPPTSVPDISTIHSFSGVGGDGAEPDAQLAISGSTFYGISNVLYGTTSDGGANGYGTIFSINSDGSDYHVLHSFTASDANPETRLLISGSTLYGATKTTVFKINTDGSGYTILSSSLVGASELVLSLSGTTLYGTIAIGGAHGVGMVFSLNTDGSSGVGDLHDFNVSDGENPIGGLDFSVNSFYLDQTVGTLYGTTEGGGANGKGTVFSVNTDGSGFRTLYNFSTAEGYPEPGMIAITLPGGLESVNPVVLYGTTAGDGISDFGTIFSISLDASGNPSPNTVYRFSSSAVSGPNGKLALVDDSSDPVLLGTTSGGGAHGKGTIFTFSDNGFSDIYDFSGSSSDGALPRVGLTMDIGDHSDSVWSLDTTLNLSDPSGIDACIAIDNTAELYVNGTLVKYLFYDSQGIFDTGILLDPYLHAGANDIRVIIGDGGDADNNDYFDMVTTNVSETYIPPAPTGVIAVPGNGQVTLTWDPVNGATGYNVYRSTTGAPGSYTLLGTTPPPPPTTTQTTYTDTTVVNGTTYYYEVTAYDVSVESSPTQAGPVTPDPAPLSAPTGLTATADYGEILLSWYPVSGATSYNIYRSTTSGGAYTLIGNTTGLTYTDVTAVEGTTYYYVVTAVNVDVEGPYSTEVNATEPIAASGMVGFWPFNEGNGTVLHDVVNGDNGTINNGTWDSGISGSDDLDFNGSSTYVAIPSTAGLNFGTSAFSISLWFKGQLDGNPYPAILTDNPGNWESGCFALRYGNGGYQGLSVHWYPTDYIVESGMLNPNIWHHAVLIRNGSTLSLYIDAVLTSTATVDPTQPINLGDGGDMYLGGHAWDGGTSYFLGSLEQLRIYSGVLTQAQITALYQDMPPVPVGYWPFNEGTGTVLHDVANGDNGIINNGTWDSGINGGPDLDFNGSSTYVAVPSTPNLNFGTSAFSICFWFNGELDNNTYPAILTDNPGDWETGCFALRFGNLQYKGLSVHWYPTDYILKSGTLNPGTWHQGVVVRSGESLSLYIDSVLVQTTTVDPTAPINLGDGGYMYLGGHAWDGSTSYFLGSLEQLSIYQVPLTQAQITSMYQAVASGLAPTITSSPQSQTVTDGSEVTLNVTATGAQSYQWQLNGVDIPGATTSTYTIPSVNASDGGDYTVVVSNPGYSVTSATASLAVLVGYWPFNEGTGTVLDDVVNGDNGTINNGTWDSGISGHDLDFNGSSTYVSIPSTANLNFGADAFSISLWFNGQLDGNPYPAILTDNPGNWETGCFALRFGNEGYQGLSVHWYPTDYILESGTLNSGTWHHAVFVRDGTMISLYIDSVLVQTATVSATDAINLGDGGYMYLGGHAWDGGTSYYLGSLEQLRIYAGALTQGEITTLFQNP